jgi:hypothetical protein
MSSIASGGISVVVVPAQARTSPSVAKAIAEELKLYQAELARQKAAA